MTAGRARDYFLDLQNRIVTALEKIEDNGFRRDTWERPEGGGGISCLTENGRVFERAVVSFSHVFGKQLPPSASASRPELAGRGFEAMGLSLVLHPRNPYAPTVHLNVRFFIAAHAQEPPVWWFGGGMDLTPYYGFVEDVEHFHREWIPSRITGRSAKTRSKRCCKRDMRSGHPNSARTLAHGPAPPRADLFNPRAMWPTAWRSGAIRLRHAPPPRGQ